MKGTCGCVILFYFGAFELFHHFFLLLLITEPIEERERLYSFPNMCVFRTHSGTSQVIKGQCWNHISMHVAKTQPPQHSDRLAHYWMSTQGFPELQDPAVSTLLIKSKSCPPSLGGSLPDMISVRLWPSSSRGTILHSHLSS